MSHLPVARSLGPEKRPADPECPRLRHETPQLPERVPGRAERAIVHLELASEGAGGQQVHNNCVFPFWFVNDCDPEKAFASLLLREE